MADFMADKPKDGFRKWRGVGRVKNEKAAEARPRSPAQVHRGPARSLQTDQARQEIAGRLLRGGHGRIVPRDPERGYPLPCRGRHEGHRQHAVGVHPGGQRQDQTHVARVLPIHSQAEADNFIAQLRNWYDTMEQQRAQMAAIYNAKTTRRC